MTLDLEIQLYMTLDLEIQLLHHSVATLRALLDGICVCVCVCVCVFRCVCVCVYTHTHTHTHSAKEADFETREREHKAGMALIKKEMEAAQSAALIASTHSADLAARLLEVCVIVYLYMCIHIYVCMYVCMNVRMYVHTYYVLTKPPMPIHYVLAAVFASCFYVLKSLLHE
jgi:hypothetical protein